MATFVLVHGTGHGSWCWKTVARQLRGLGHEVFTPTLTGDGERSHLRAQSINLSTHIADVVNLLFYEDLRDVVLVGHSYAGMVVAGVAGATPERIGRVIYLDAYMPKAGESWYSLQLPGVAERVQAEAAGARFREPGTPASYGVTDPAVAAWTAERLTSHPLATYEEPLPDGDPLALTIPRAYIHCTQGRSVPNFARFAAMAAAEGSEVRYLDTGHDAMLTVPDELSRVLVELAG